MPPPLQVDLLDILTLKVVFESHDVGYLCANFSLPRPLFVDLGPMYERQTDVRRQVALPLLLIPCYFVF